MRCHECRPARGWALRALARELKEAERKADPQRGEHETENDGLDARGVVGDDRDGGVPRGENPRQPPGAIRTQIDEEVMEDKKQLNALLANIPLRRVGTPEEIAGVAAFLTSKDVDHFPGTTIFVDTFQL